MFNNIIAKIKGVLSKMGLVKSVKELSSMRDLSIDDEFYGRIEEWKSIYKGYNKEWHDMTIHTIGGEKKDRMKSLGMGKVIAAEMATIVFNERCEIGVSDKSLQAYLDEVLKENSFSVNFQRYLEYQFAIGGMVVKPYYDDDEIKLSYVTADSFVPISWTNSGISEGVFIHTINKGKYKYTHLEWHLFEEDVYVIKNELFRTEVKSKEIGVKVSLDLLFEGLEEEVPVLNVSRPWFVYFHPNTANNFDMQSPLGVSIFANATDTMRTLDTAYDSFFREFKLGKRRIIVPATAVNTVVDSSGKMHRYFDANDEVYQAMDLGGMDDGKIVDNTVEIRAEEHIGSINALLNILAMQTGFSSGSFSFDGSGGVKTATEVVSENSKTFRTKQSHEVIVEEGLSALVDIIVEMSEIYGLFSVSKEYETSVTFDDSIAEDKTAETDRETNLVNNKLQSRKKAIAKIHGITEKEAEELMKEIDEENKTVGGNGVDFFGLNKPPVPPNDDEDINLPPIPPSGDGNDEDL